MANYFANIGQTKFCLPYICIYTKTPTLDGRRRRKFSAIQGEINFSFALCSFYRLIFIDKVKIFHLGLDMVGEWLIAKYVVENRNMA